MLADDVTYEGSQQTSVPAASVAATYLQSFPFARQLGLT